MCVCFNNVWVHHRFASYTATNMTYTPVRFAGTIKIARGGEAVNIRFFAVRLCAIERNWK